MERRVEGRIRRGRRREHFRRGTGGLARDIVVVGCLGEGVGVR